jgi:hypothetical protein
MVEIEPDRRHGEREQDEVHRHRADEGAAEDGAKRLVDRVARCDVYTTDASALAATRVANVPAPLTQDDFMILPEIISKEPLAPAVRHGDNQWTDIVRWTQYAMIEAEEYGINSKNVDEMLKSDNPAIKRILGVTPGMGKALGVDEKWVYTIVKHVGNYGESFDRNLGPDSPLKIARGPNALWTLGGLLYAPPIRCGGPPKHIPFGCNQPNGICLLQQQTPVRAFPIRRNRTRFLRIGNRSNASSN